MFIENEGKNKHIHVMYTEYAGLEITDDSAVALRT